MLVMEMILMLRNIAIAAVVLLVVGWQAHAFVPASRSWFSVLLSSHQHPRRSPTPKRRNANRLYYRNNQHDGKNETTTISTSAAMEDRFARTACSQKALLDQLCVLTIDSVRYNVTAWGECYYEVQYYVR